MYIHTMYQVDCSATIHRCLDSAKLPKLMSVLALCRKRWEGSPGEDLVCDDDDDGWLEKDYTV